MIDKDIEKETEKQIQKDIGKNIEKWIENWIEKVIENVLGMWKENCIEKDIYGGDKRKKEGTKRLIEDVRRQC